MRKLSCILLALVLVLLSGAAAFADAESLPTIDEALRAGASEKTEVSDNLDEYSVFNETFEDFTEAFRVLVLQREAPYKEFTAAKVYPPFTNANGFPDDFTGVDEGSPSLWLRADLMQRIPEEFRASSLADATYIILADTLYEWDGTLSESDYKDSDDGELPEFESAEEMAQYFMEHPREVESITYYPKFGIYSVINVFEAKTAKAAMFDYTYAASRRFAKNPEAAIQLDSMSYLVDLLSELDAEQGPDEARMEAIIRSLDFVPEETQHLWLGSLFTQSYDDTRTYITDYYWTMAEQLKDLDSDRENKANYDLILSEKNLPAFQLFANWCDYGGFTLPISTIGAARAYMAEADPEWIEEKLTDLVSIFSAE
ncbi:MAG: hypothetical protein ILO68_07870 [Clostridia bacterium]|nr:hypothetical protein [Clostridia bacterium]